METVADLFYQEGVRAVGIDAVVDRSGVSKSSPYRTFESKAPEFRGCPFVNLATEIPDRKHPGTAIACANKAEVRRRLRELCERLGVGDPHRLGDRLALIIDGAYGRAVTLGADGLEPELLEMVRLVIESSPKRLDAGRARGARGGAPGPRRPPSR